jgi:hypothetical protein
LFSSAGASVKNKNKPATAEKEKTMKLEEIKNKTHEAFSYLLAALDSLTQLSQRDGPIPQLLLSMCSIT